jgi:hypothetical protein
MNRRINEIADEAAVMTMNLKPDKTVHRRSYLYDEVFAKLLLTDCLKNIEAWEKDSRNHISYLLRIHYGVEE